MGLSKSDISTAQQNGLANVLKVLSHPARIAILQHIIMQLACICKKNLNLPKPPFHSIRN